MMLSPLSRGYITSKELADAGGVSLSTIQYYTAIGLLHSNARAGNKRLYDAKRAKERLKQIQRMRQDGYSLALIRQQLNGRAR
jgi:DNA-binding transcriptional MerR regulator